VTSRHKYLVRQPVRLLREEVCTYHQKENTGNKPFHDKGPFVYKFKNNTFQAVPNLPVISLRLERGLMNRKRRARRMPAASCKAAAAVHGIPVLLRSHPARKVSPSISRNRRILPFPAMPDIVLLTVSMQATATRD